MTYFDKLQEAISEILKAYEPSKKPGKNKSWRVEMDIVETITEFSRIESKETLIRKLTNG